MKLHNNQIGLLRHLARFQMLAYPDCLEMLDTEQTGDRTALSYAFRPLTKNKYVSKQKDGGVSILAKGRALFPDITPLISAGGGAAERRRVMAVSRMAALMERSGIPCFGERRDGDEPYFIPSACWRNIAHGILSTTRFTGMLMGGWGDGVAGAGGRLAVLHTVRQLCNKGHGDAPCLSAECQDHRSPEHHPADHVEPSAVASGQLCGTRQARAVVSVAH